MNNYLYKISFAFCLLFQSFSSLELNKLEATSFPALQEKEIIKSCSFFDITDPKKRDYDYFFSADIFDSYLSQLRKIVSDEIGRTTLLRDMQNHLENSFAARALELYTLIYSPPESVDESRVLHEKIILQLREFIEAKQALPQSLPLITKEDYITAEAIHLMDSICVGMYTKIDLLSSFSNFLTGIEPQLLNSENIEKTPLIRLTAEVLAALEKNSSISGHFSPNPALHDLHLEGYLPSLMYKAFSTQFTLAPRITIENDSTDEIEINPEFINYLRFLKLKGKTHLYINLLARSGKDKKISNAIEGLSNQEEFKGTFMVLGLCKSSDFYWQEKEFEHSSCAAEFKQIFMDQLFDVSEEANFKWINESKDESFKKTIFNLIERIHLQYFGYTEELSSEERQDFIEIMFVNLVQIICEKYQPDYTNITCKYSIDRAPSLVSILYVHHLVESNLPWTLEDNQKLLAILFAPSILSHNRPAHDYRIERFNTAYIRLIVCRKKWN